ncbi:hypothetical protein [Hyalangium versicolor]|uniref:hypothetical protein n=1 Tax=Hyalangium versicolor TaxID=2861190 RepID=UPI001CCBF0D7|nr:hypothetical protein [Hyalangium versicolor]
MGEAAKAAQRSQRRPLRLAMVCPACHKTHSVGLLMTVEPQPLFFGGSSGRTGEALRTLSVACPLSGERAEVTFQLPVSNGERLLEVQVESISAEPGPGQDEARPAPTPGSLAAETSPPAEDWMRDALLEARKGSAARLRTFATTMLSTSTGAVAVHFTVLRYLGLEHIGESWRVLTLLPAMAFLLAAFLFVLTLRPVLAWVGTDAQFSELYRTRLLAIGRIATAGVLLFLGGIATAIAAYAALLW